MKKRILKLLEKEARLTDEELGAALGISAEEVKKEICELEGSGVIRGYKCIIDHEALADGAVTAIIELKVIPRAGRGFEYVAEIISNYPQVEYCALLSGASDLIVNVRGKNLQEISAFVSRELALIEGVTATSTQFVMKKYKELGVCLFGDEDDDRRRVSL